MKKIFRTDIYHDHILKDWYVLNSNLDYDRELQSKNRKVKELIRESLSKMQSGFCAYTERFIENGTIDHFNPNLKHVDGFNFSNLFLVDAEVNNKRSEHLGVPVYLKPDEMNYNPEKYLIFSLVDFLFHANPKLDLDLQKVIELEIEMLGINLVKGIRKRRLEIVLRRLSSKEYLNTEIEDEEYETAYNLAQNF